MSKFLTITPHLYHLPPLQTSKLLNFMRIYHKISLCISPSMLNFQTTVISFISLHYQSDKHSSFFLCTLFSPPTTLVYTVLHDAVQQIQFSFFPSIRKLFQIIFPETQHKSTLHLQRTIHIYN